MSREHGNTPAAWTAVTVMFVGCLVGAVGVVFASHIWLLFVGVGIIVAGALTGKIMQMMGLGQTPAERLGHSVDPAPRH